MITSHKILQGWWDCYSLWAPQTSVWNMMLKKEKNFWHQVFKSWLGHSQTVALSSHLVIVHILALLKHFVQGDRNLICHATEKLFQHGRQLKLCNFKKWLYMSVCSCVKGSFPTSVTLRAGLLLLELSGLGHSGATIGCNYIAAAHFSCTTGTNVHLTSRFPLEASSCL